MIFFQLAISLIQFSQACHSVQHTHSTVIFAKVKLDNCINFTKNTEIVLPSISPSIEKKVKQMNTKYNEHLLYIQLYALILFVCTCVVQ